MPKKCPKCKKGAPGWMVTFGDMMALLLTFFVLLLSFAQLDIVKFKKASGSLKTALGVQQLEQTETIPTEPNLVLSAYQQELVLVKIQEQVAFVVNNLVNNLQAEVIETEQGFILQLDNDAIFTGENMGIRNDFEPVLQQIANILSTRSNMVRITGHTDDRPPGFGSPYPNNWVVSGVKAAAVANYLATRGQIDPARIQVFGVGQWEPIQGNQDARGRAHNNRIEIQITKASLPPPGTSG